MNEDKFYTLLWREAEGGAWNEVFSFLEEGDAQDLFQEFSVSVPNRSLLKMRVRTASRAQPLELEYISLRESIYETPDAREYFRNSMLKSVPAWSECVEKINFIALSHIAERVGMGKERFAEVIYEMFETREKIAAYNKLTNDLPSQFKKHLRNFPTRRLELLAGRDGPVGLYAAAIYDYAGFVRLNAEDSWSVLAASILSMFESCDADTRVLVKGFASEQVKRRIRDVDLLESLFKQEPTKFVKVEF